MAFLLVTTSLKRVGDLQALSVASSCLELAPGRMKAILHPRPGYLPKVLSNIAHSAVLHAFHPRMFADQEKLNLLWCVLALEMYVRRTAWWRKTDQLLVCFRSPKKGS